MNPILKQMNSGMGDMLSAVKSGNANAIYQQLLQSNPRFQQFVNENKGLTEEQMAQKYGINVSDVYNMMR